jgi:hypothetical protein
MKASIAYDIEKYLWLAGIPRGPKSKAYCVDPVNGSDSNVGTNWLAPLKTMAAAEDMCVGDQHDAVLFISGDSADNPAAAISWAKDYTHLIGLSSGVYGLGQRCRLVGLAATLLSPIITFSGNGCIIKNMQFSNEKAAGAAAGVAAITGMRNYFENVFFMAPTANDAASYSLKCAGAENVFKHCTIGQETNPRHDASYGLWLHKGAGSSVSRNWFDNCLFLSWIDAAGTHAHVRFDADIVAVPWLTIFEDCLFVNVTGAAGYGVVQAQAIDDNCTAPGHHIILKGKNSFAGCTVVADTLTYIYNQSKFAGGLMAALTES